MKTLFLSLLLFTSSAFAEYQWSAENPTYTQLQAPEPRLISGAFVSTDAWTTGDTYREVAFQILNVIDWGQTRYVAQHPEQFHEKDTQDGYSAAQFIGRNPTTKRVDIYMAESAIFHYVVVRTLIFYDLRKLATVFQYTTIALKLDATIGNASIGAKISF